MSGPIFNEQRTDKPVIDAQAPAADRPPPSIFKFDWDANKASAAQAYQDVPGRARQSRMVELSVAGSQLAKALGKRFDAYEVIMPGEPTMAGDEKLIDEAALFRDLNEYRKAHPGFLAELGNSPADYDARFKARMAGEAKSREARMAKGGFIGNLPGGILGSFTDPINIVTMPLGGGGKTIAAKIVRNAVTNMAVEAAETPLTALERQAQGRDFTLGEAGANIALAGAGGAVLTAGGHAIGAGLKVAGKAAAGMVPDDVKAAMALRSAANRGFAMTDEQAAALHVLERDGEVQASNPFVRTYDAIDAHAKAIQDVQRALAAAPEEPALVTRPRVASPATAAVGGFDMDRYMGRNRVAESGGSDAAAAATSSAYGRYQFLKSSWLRTYREVFGQTGESDAAILAKRADGAVQDQVMRRFTLDNVRALRNAGVPVDDGAVYLAHFLGTADAIKVLRAGADASVSGLVRAESIAANRAVFDQAGTAGALVGWARRKMSQDPGVATASAPVADPLLVRPDAMDAVRPQISTGGREVPIASFAPAEIGVDANLMQFKSGGDAMGVTERLRGVQQWDPIAAGMVTVWEGLDGRRLIADGHQRLGLANRIAAADPAQEIRLNAFVLREADGFTATDARILTALKNIGEGTGTAADAGKVFRAVGLDNADVMRRLPPRSALVRDGKSLARLSDDAFGAVVNEVIPEGYGAAIGELAPDSSTHMALVDLLHQVDPPNRRQAEAVLRQALEAGFARETQDELFGARDMATALFAQRAKLLDKTIGELRKLKGAFQVAARNAEALDQAGNRIDVGASEAAAAGNAKALGLVEALALRKGNEVNALFNDAARSLAEGKPIAAATRDLVAGIRQLDLERALRDADGAGDPALGSGRDGLAADEAGAGAGDADLAPATRDELEAAGQAGFFGFDEPALKQFDDPAGEGVKATAASDWHDITAEAAATKAVAGVDTSNSVPLPQADTRGAGVQYHGARGEIANLSEGHYNSKNIYGGFDTFYTTDAVDIAGGYKRKQEAGKIYRVDEVAPVKKYDMEVRQSPEEIAALLGETDYRNAAGFVASSVEGAVGNDGKVSLREAMDQMRHDSSGEGLSRDDVQEYFDAAVYNLQQAGYGAMEHVGGVLTGKEPHRVVIYFNAKDQLKLTPTEGSVVGGGSAKEITPKPMESAPPAAQMPEKEITIGGEKIDLDDGKGPRPIAEIEAELKRGEDGLDAIKGCL